MEDQKLRFESLGQLESIGEGPMRVFRKIGTEQNLLEHGSLLLRTLKKYFPLS
jgi:hypothetical protein